ncbi:MAG: PQQ-binding-like beta-propeller repeat protein, partial [Anaerolineales bacterium]
QNAATAQSESYARATQQAIAEEQAEARAVAEEQALEERDRSIVAEQDALEQREEALHQAAIGLASQAELQAKGPAPETSVLLALEAVENYPSTWQAERALGNAILNSRLRMVVPYDDFFQSLEWSTDGSKVLISGMELIDESTWKNANTRVLDASTGEELLRITEGEPNMASWSPDESLMLALNEQDEIVTVWDVESGKARLTLDIEDIGGDLNTNTVDWEPWSPGGDRFMLYTVEGLVKIFDALSGETLQTLSGHEGAVITQATWSPMGDQVVVSSIPDSVIVYQADTGQALYTIPGGFEDDIVVFGSWSPSGDRFVTRGLGGAKVYEAATGQLLLNLSYPQTYCWRALWSPDGSHILTQDGVESATVWDAESGQVLSRFKDIVNVRRVEWSPSGDLVAVAGADGFIHIWDVVSGQEVQKLAGTFGWASWFRFSPDGKRILAIGDDNKINSFDLTEASLNIPISTCNVITNPAWSPDGQQVAFGSNCPPDYPVKIWDANSGKLLLELIGNKIIPDWVSWSPSGDRILTTYADGSVKIWDAFSDGLLQTFTGHEINISSAAWSPDESQIATGDINGNLIVWDPSNSEEIISFVGHKGGQINSARWSPDGSRLMSTNDQGEAIIWDAATGEVLLELFPEDFKIAVSDAAWTKDGGRVILFSEDGFVRIFDSSTGEQISQFFTRSGSSITQFSLSPSEERMIIGGNDNLATVWDIATGTEVLTYQIGGFVWPVYSPDGTQVLIGSTEGDWGKLQIFPVWESLEEILDYAKECCVVRELTADEREVFGLPPR